MRRGLRRGFSTSLVLALGLLSACGGEDNQQNELVAVQEAVVVELEEAKKALDTLRTELADLEAKLAEPEGEADDQAVEGEGEEAEEAQEAFDPEAAAQRAEELKAEIESSADDLGSRIVTFINDDPPISGEPLNDRQSRAIEIKVDEDILLAQDYVREGGDYKRALSILEGLIPLAPDHVKLQEEIASAKELRFMTEERFAAVKKGMTEDDVRQALGQVNLRNVRDYEEKNVTAWFYPKDGGGAAGVWFEEKRGKRVAYKMDFNAIKSQEEGEEGGE